MDDIKDTLNEIKVSQLAMQKDLEYHIKRTNLLEEQVKVINDEIRPMLPQIKLVLKWWPILSVAVIAMLAGKPDLIQALFKQFGIGVP